MCAVIRCRVCAVMRCRSVCCENVEARRSASKSNKENGIEQ